MAMMIVDVHEISALKGGLKRRIKNLEHGKKTKKKEDEIKRIEKLIVELENIADEIKELNVDYVVVGDKRIYVVERKSIIDMLGSIRGGHGKQSGRFWNQLKRVKYVAEEMSREYEIEAVPIVIIEGSQFKRYRARSAKMTPSQWMGIQIAIAEMGVSLVRTWSLNETILLLKQLKKRAGKEIKMRGLNIKKSLRTEKEEAAHVLYAISGIGMEKAINALERFGSVKEVVNLDESILVDIFGKKTGKHFYKIVNMNFRKNKELI